MAGRRGTSLAPARSAVVTPVPGLPETAGAD